MNKIIKDIKEALSADTKTKAYDTQAKVVREEGSTLWVHIPGGVDETPVKKTISAKAGDTVQVRVSGGSAWLVGNQSAPPTDDTTAIIADRKASEVRGIATLAQELSEKAEQTAISAQISANGKNTIYYGASEPTGGTYKTGDTWFNSSEDNAIYTWDKDTSQWVKEELGEDAIANLSITNAKIANGTIQNGKIANLDAGKITAGNLSAAVMETNVVSAINATVDKIDAKNINVDGTLIVGASDVQTAIDDIDVGGTNLLPNSKNLCDFTKESDTYITRIIRGDHVELTRKVVAGYEGNLYGIYYRIGVNPSTEYTVSFDISGVASGSVALGIGQYSPSDPSISQWSGLSNGYQNITTDGRYKLTFNSSAATKATIYLGMRNPNSVEYTINVSNMKLETGNMATDWTPALGDVVGGMNLIPHSKNLNDFTKESDTYVTRTITDNYVDVTRKTASGGTNYGLYYRVNTTSNTNYTISFDISGVTADTVSLGIGQYTPSDASVSQWTGLSGGYQQITEDGKFIFTFNSRAATKATIYIALKCTNGVQYTVRISNLKMEVGYTITDWTPAPSDLAETATSYITKIDSGGIKVHDSGDTTNYAKLDANGMQVYQGGAQVANFDSDSVDLGMNSTTSEINLCNSSGRMTTENSNLIISSKNGISINSYDYNWYTPSSYKTQGTLELLNGGFNYYTSADSSWGITSSTFAYPRLKTVGTYYGNTDIYCPVVWIGTGNSSLWHGLYSGKQFSDDGSTGIDDYIICVDANKNIRIPKAYTDTTTAAANMNIASGGVVKRYSTSSKRYKKDIKDVENKELDPTRLYDARVVQFKYRDEYLDKTDQRYKQDICGFIVEELEKVYPIAIDYEDGKAEDWNLRYIVPPMLKLIQDQKKEIDELKSIVAELAKEKK